MDLCNFFKVAFIINLAIYTEAYSKGSPVSSCANLNPSHGTYESQVSPPPYSVLVTPQVYNPGDVITVSLQSSPSHMFRGFIVRASRLSGDTEEIVGEFTMTPNLTQPMQWYPQEQEFKNCVTHTSKTTQENVTLEWQAPDWESLGDIVFTATFVQRYDLFWVNVKSPVVKALQAAPPSTFNSSVSLDFGAASISSGCGVNKGCLMFPRYCSGDDCSHIVTYKAHDDYIDFEMKSKTNGYTSVGFSRDLWMGDDETVSCIVKGDWVSFQHGYSPAYYNNWHRITGFTNIETMREGEFVYCRWTQPYVHSFVNTDWSTYPPKITTSTFDLKNEEYYLQLAFGKVKAGGQKVGHHTELPLVSAHKVNLLRNTIVNADSLPLHTKIHAMLGVIAWMLLAGTAVTTARFFRKDILAKKMCALPVWFQLHRALSFLTGMLTATSIVLMFAYIQKILQHSLVHCILSLIVMGLVIIQVIAGLCRPGLDHKHRAVFNWIHRIGGTVTYMTAGATLLMSTYVPTLHGELADRLFITFILWIIVQVLFFIMLQLLEDCRVGKVYQMESSKNGLHLEEPKPANGSNVAKACLLVLYITSNVALTVAAVVLIYIY